MRKLGVFSNTILSGLQTDCLCAPSCKECPRSSSLNQLTRLFVLSRIFRFAKSELNGRVRGSRRPRPASTPAFKSSHVQTQRVCTREEDQLCVYILYMYIYTHTCMHTYIHTHIYIYIYIYVHMCIGVCVCVVCVCVWVCVYALGIVCPSFH